MKTLGRIRFRRMPTKSIKKVDDRFGTRGTEILPKEKRK